MKYKIVSIVSVLLVVLLVLWSMGDDNLQSPGDQGDWHIAHRQQCSTLCDRYIESDFDAQEGVAYCENYFERDWNENGKIHGDAVNFEGYGICEDRIYGFTIKECNWGSKDSARLTLEKCKTLMCEYYTNQTGDYRQAESIIREKIQFGSCDPYDEEITFEDENGSVRTRASWWTDNFRDVECP